MAHVSPAHLAKHAAASPYFRRNIANRLWGHMMGRALVEPRDGAWALGAWLMGTEVVDPEAIYSHLRSWAVKAFFLAFMLAIVPPGFGDFIRADWQVVLTNPIALANWLITFMFVIDVAFATVGYVLTMRPLDAHIRSGNPFLGGWIAALICYPPMVWGIMGNAQFVNYQQNTPEWLYWMQGNDLWWRAGARGLSF